MKLSRALLLAVVLPTLLCAQTQTDTSPTYVLRRATVLAFFVGADHAREIDSNGNETLSDFQLYFSDAKSPLKKMGVDLVDTIAPAFHVRFGSNDIFLKPAQSVGYYFLAPGREPRVEYGVRTDGDLLTIAREYFGSKPGKHSGASDLAH